MFGGDSGKFPNYGSTSGVDDMRPRSTSNLSLCNQLFDNISCNLVTIQNCVTSLERAFRDIGTPADSDLLREEIHEHRTKAKDMVATTTRFMRDLKTAVQREQREQRLRADRLEADYRSCLERYDTLQKKLVPKMQMCPIPARRKSDNVWGVAEESQENLLDAEKLQQQKQIQEDLEFEHGMLLEREAKIRQIETDILDVNEVFRLLGAKIQEQGAMVGTIEENISHVAHDVEAGTDQLAKASGYQKAYRNKLCWLMLLVLIICVAVAIWLIVTNK